MAKETPTQKLKRELAEAEAQRDGYRKEASSLRKQINGRLEETDGYKNLVKQVDALTLDRNTAIKQRDRYKADTEKLQDQLKELKDQLEELQDRLKELEDQANQKEENQTTDELEEEEKPFCNMQDDERTKKVADYIKKAYAYSPQKKILEDVKAESIAGYWRTITASKDAFDILIEYFEGRLSATKRQMQAQNEKIQDLELQAKDRESTKQFNATMGNYAALSELSKQLKAKQVELDASVTAQNALQIDYDSKCRELQELQQNVSKGSKNPFGAGRKRAYTDRIDEIKKLHDEGMSGRKIAEALGVPSATVTRYIRRESKQI